MGDVLFCSIYLIYFILEEIGDAGSVDGGLGFMIDAKVSVNGASQYKVYNSKGENILCNCK